jgi:hypothetical protein
VSKHQPYHLKRGKVEHALQSLDYNVQCLQHDYREPRERRWDADARRHLEENVRLLAEESSAFQNGDGLLGSAAVYLLHQLNEICSWDSPTSLAKKWGRLGPRLSRALYEFLYHRDAPEAERAFATRIRRRKKAALVLKRGRVKRLDNAQRRRQMVRQCAEYLKNQGVERREFASRIPRMREIFIEGRRFPVDVKLEPSSIRTILKELRF